MIPVYRSAASESGGGKAARQRSTVQGHIEQGVIFPKMGIAMSESMNKLIRTTSQRLKSMLSGVLATVSTDLDIVFHSYQRSRAALDEGRERKIRDFASEVKILRKRHEQLLQTVEGI
jgi:hypothetical protein